MKANKITYFIIVETVITKYIKHIKIRILIEGCQTYTIYTVSYQ
jgi:hypothetical protein